MRTAFLLWPWLLAGAACAAWAWQSDRLLVTHGLALLMWLIGAGLVFTEWRHRTEGVLRWDGQHWRWEVGDGSRVGVVLIHLDWQRGVLIEFQALDGKTLWLWPERHSAPLYWDALRRALYAPPPTVRDPDPQPAAGGGS